jgi:hypothetical protein
MNNFSRLNHVNMASQSEPLLALGALPLIASHRE